MVWTAQVARYCLSLGWDEAMQACILALEISGDRIFAAVVTWVVVLQALSTHGADAWLKAAQAIPRKISSMYMHAVQSFVWNTVASARLRMHGRHVIAGDLVIPGGVWPDGGSADSALTPHACEQKLATGDESAAKAGSDGKGEVAPERKRLKSDAAGTAPHRTARARMEMVAVVAPEDVAKGRYSIEDVVLPLPGSEVQYPEWPPGAQRTTCDALHLLEPSKPVL